MKKTADDFHFFIAPIKYRLDYVGIKATSIINLMGVGAMPLIYLLLDSLEYDGFYVPSTTISKGITVFFLVINALIILSLPFYKTKIYDSLVYFLSGWALIEIGYFLIIWQFTDYLARVLRYEDQIDFAFNVLLLLPLFLLLLGVIFYVVLIRKGRTHRNDPKVVAMEKKVRGDTDTVEKWAKSSQITLIGATVGIVVSAFFNSSLTMFLGMVAVACFISFIASKSLMMSYVKLRFPKSYSEKSLLKQLDKEGWKLYES